MWYRLLPWRHWLMGALLLLSGAALAVAAGTFYDFDGEPRRLEEFLGQGKWTVVTVWASDCPVCNREIHEMVAFHAAHRKRDATVLGIAVDGPAGKADAQAFIERHRLNFPNLLDPGGALGALYLRIAGTPWFGGTPMHLIFNPAGEPVARRIGTLGQSELEAFLAREAQGPQGALKPARCSSALSIRTRLHCFARHFDLHFPEEGITCISSS